MYLSTSTQTFTIYPAIDLRKGQIVRPLNGDMTQPVVYPGEPAAIAKRWIDAGAKWLHVTNVDAYLGADTVDTQEALVNIIKVAKVAGVRAQVGGGLRTLDQVGRVLNMGYKRALLGTAAIRQPFILAAALDKWGPDRIGVSLTARRGRLVVNGGREETDADPLTLARWFYQMGLRWLVFTDLTRDDLTTGAESVEIPAFSSISGLNVILSGGFETLEELRAANEAGLAGIMVQRALLERHIDPQVLFAWT